MTTPSARAPWLGFVLLTACFGNPDTLGLPCSEDMACLGGQVCEANVCVEPSAASSADSNNGDGEPGDGDAETSESNSTTGDGDPETGDGDPDTGDGDPGDGDGDGDVTGDGDGDGDADTGEPVCGDGMREGAEVCDGTDLNGMTCADFPPWGGGTIMCNEDCNFDLSDCCKADGTSCTLGDKCCNGMCIALDLDLFKCG